MAKGTPPKHLVRAGAPLGIDLPVRGSSVALSMYRLEVASRDIHEKLQASLARSSRNSTLFPPLNAYVRFRRKAFKLLAHFVDAELTEAFGWYLIVSGKARNRPRASLEYNPFHWGLLAMSAAAGTFMHPNKLRIIAMHMQTAHAAGISDADLEAHIQSQRRAERKMAIEDTVNFLKTYAKDAPEEVW